MKEDLSVSKRTNLWKGSNILTIVLLFHKLTIDYENNCHTIMLCF